MMVAVQKCQLRPRSMPLARCDLQSMRNEARGRIRGEEGNE